MLRRTPVRAMLLPLVFAGTDLARGQDQETDTIVLKPIVLTGSQSGIPEPRYGSELLPPAAGGQVATGSQLGFLGNRDALSTPFNVTGYTSKLIADTQARSVADVAANDPSVRTIFPRSSYRDVYSIRGFNLFSYNTGFDGLYGIAPKQRYPAEFAERIEILKGPDTFINGVSLGGSVGGAINIIPKRATDEPVTSITTSYISDGNYGSNVDFGRRLGSAKQFGVRFNGLINGGDLAIDDQSERLAAAALSLDYQGDDFRLYGDFGVQKHHINAPDWTATVAPGITAIPVPGSTTSLSQPWAGFRTQDVYGVLRAEYDLSDSWTAFGAFGISTTETNGIYVQPELLKASGDYTGLIRSFPSSGTHYSGQIGIRGQFATGPLTHNTTLTLARWNQDLKLTGSILGRFRSNIFSPVSVTRPDTSSIVDLDDIHDTARPRYSSLAFADTMGLFDERLLLTIGGRWQNIASASFNAVSGAETSSYDRWKFSPALGAVFKASDHLSFYGNYVEALQQGSSAPQDAINYGETFAPAVSRQLEAGVKVDWGTWTTSLGIFQITQPNGLTDPATHIYSIAGEQRNRGIELNVAGEPIDKVRLLGGITLLDGRVTKADDERVDGNKAIGVPNYQINLGLEWDTPFVDNLTLSMRMISTGAQFVNSSNSQKIDDWTRFDVGARYTIERSNGKPITFRLAVENVFDKDYWASASSGQASGISRGAPRTLLASTTFQF
ncbi:TonB-dependent receptor [Phyllobacterium myrsinacearum]|uniref:TonB-dependent receptor n=1 Tax=Phyllobacterium myrsinacearum TaxID=28101 RepID=UPI00102A2BB7|nr:TonB-dependent siderophore receptor [Phyllobacterium myrsinacearum]